MPVPVSRTSRTSRLAPADRPLDPRGPRLAAALTTVVLAVVLLVGRSPAGLALLAAQTLVFAVGALVGPAATPYAWAFRRFVRPRLAPPSALEDPRPPRFAQAVGLSFSAVALVAMLAGATLIGLVAVGAALAAAFLNAAFGLCLGCELYLLLRRSRVPAA